jgi:hypothetical protein
MLTCNTDSFWFYICDGGHGVFRGFEKDRILSIFKGCPADSAFLEKVFSTAHSLKIKNSAIGQNYFVF